MDLDSLLQIFGGAGATFYVMWLWLKEIKLEKKGIIEQLKEEQDARIQELREMLPLLTEASKGLQEVIKSNIDGNTEVIEKIKQHIDTKMISCNERMTTISKIIKNVNTDDENGTE